MSTLFTLLFLLFSALFIISLIRPSLFKTKSQPNPTRKTISLGFFLFGFFSLIIAGATAPKSSNIASVQPSTSPVSTITPIAQAKITATPAPTPKSTLSAKAATPSPAPSFKNGTLKVGQEIIPGTYRTRSGSRGCYFSRLKGFDGSLDSIISNNNTDYPAVVDIAIGDVGFKSSNCATWTQNLSQITNSKTNFNDGMYIVGVDIEPGTYRNIGQSGCYYSRLSNFSGELDGILANENTNEQAIVTINSSDKGFSSSRCGAWTKLQN